MFGEAVGPLDCSARLSLKWPDWYPATADDRQREAQTLSTLALSGQISRRSAVQSIADMYDIEDVDAELARIAEDRTQAGIIDARERTDEVA